MCTAWASGSSSSSTDEAERAQFLDYLGRVSAQANRG